MNFLPDNANLSYRPPIEENQCANCSVDKASLKCSRCHKARYCNKECQVAHWKAHKRTCIPYNSEGAPKAIPASQFDSSKPPTGQEKEFIKKIIEDAKAGKKGPNDTICSTCGSISKCVNASEGPLPGSIPGDGSATGSAMFVCGNGHSSVASDVRFSLKQECTCNIRVNPIRAPLTPEQERTARALIPSTLRVLIVTCFDRFNTTNSCYYKALAPRFQSSGIPFDVIHADNGPILTRSLMTRKYNALIFLHLDEKGFERNMDMFGGTHIGTLYHWIQFGGKFILHGEGDLMTQFVQSFTDKPWHFCGDYYRRIKHYCNRETFSHFPLQAEASSAGTLTSSGAKGGVKVASTPSSSSSRGGGGGDGSDDETPSAGQEAAKKYLTPKSITMKATTLCGVSVEDRLYSPVPGARCISNVPGFGGHVVNHERTGVAYTRKGEGFVCYVGDVNAEVKTVDLIVALLQK